ncbi:hypothetical protein FA15DRAFT_705611 [Coprinopsis marcescibilis]|uniref:Uncharacterized protein n=1 Tax=Coprinopsis marcescibilis TaxID=230819 RepID=A0A5C3KRQ6_COPMA|nr:hypothetical protein FA15DRAFT_705611 [Coprinopsis marcescibilis]
METPLHSPISQETTVLDPVAQPAHTRLRLKVVNLLVKGVVHVLQDREDISIHRKVVDDLASRRENFTRIIDELAACADTPFEHRSDDIQAYRDYLNKMEEWVETTRSRTLIPLQCLQKEAEELEYLQNQRLQQFTFVLKEARNPRSFFGPPPDEPPCSLEWHHAFSSSEDRLAYVVRKVAEEHEKIEALEMRYKACARARTLFTRKLAKSNKVGFHRAIQF